MRKEKFFLHWRADGGMVGLDSPVEGGHTRADRGVRPCVFCRAQRQRKKKAPETLRSQGFRGLARKEGFEPYGRCKWQVLKCRQMRSFQGFPSEPLIPLTRHLWSTSWSKRGAIRRCKAPKGKSLHCGSTPPSLPESIYDMCAKVKRIAESCAILKSIRLALGNSVTPTKEAALTR